jgi:hypothetical protein
LAGTCYYVIGVIIITTSSSAEIPQGIVCRTYQDGSVRFDRPERYLRCAICSMAGRRYSVTFFMASSK